MRMSERASELKKLLEEKGELTWLEIKEGLGLKGKTAGIKIKRALEELGDQICLVVKDGRKAYKLKDREWLLHEVKDSLEPVNGLTSTLYVSKKMREFLGKSISEDWDTAIRRGDHGREVPRSLDRVADFLHKAQGALEDYLEMAAEESVVLALPKAQQELFREYEQYADYLGFLDERLLTVRQERQRSLTDAQILKSLNETMKEGLKLWGDVPAAKEARQIYEAVLSSPGEDVAKKLKSYLVREPARLGAFGIYFSPMLVNAPSVESVPLTKWEKGEVRRLTRGMRISDHVKTEKWALLASLGERDVVLVKYARRLEQVRLREELGEKIDALLQSVERGEDKARKIVLDFLRALERELEVTRESGASQGPLPARFDKFSNHPFFDGNLAVYGFIGALGLRQDPMSLEEQGENSSFAVGKLYAGRDSLPPNFRSRIAKLAPLYLSDAPRGEGLAREGSERGTPGRPSKHDLQVAKSLADEPDSP